MIKSRRELSVAKNKLLHILFEIYLQKSDIALRLLMNPALTNCATLWSPVIAICKRKFYLLFIFCLHCISLAFSQKKPEPSLLVELKGKYENNRFAKPAVLSSLPKPISSKTFTEECNNSTFYLRIPAGSYKSILMEDMETMPDGSYIISASVVKADNTKSGLLISIDNKGAMLYQRELKVNNQDVSLSKIKVRYDGSMIISGLMTDGSNKVFVADLNNDLTIRWLRVLQMPSAPATIVADILEFLPISFAVQLPGEIVFGLIDDTGNLVWQKKISPVGLQKLVGFTGMNFEKMCLVNNCVRNGKMLTELYEVDGSNGQILGSNERGNGAEDNAALAVGSFGNRLRILALNKNSANFTLQRDITYTSSLAEINHSYSLSANMDFTFSSAALDNAGDIMALSTAQDGKLLLVKQYSDYYTQLSFTTRYNIPVGSNVNALARSFDGGILCGLTNGAQNELILMKTDSIGILPGCGYENAANAVTEKLLASNNTVSVTQSNLSLNTSPANINYTSASFSTQFNCNQKYCATVPAADTCMSTYYKTFRTNSYTSVFDDYFLMRNNRHIAITRRYDRVIGVGNVVTSGVSLFDESEKFIKGVSIYSNDVAVEAWAYAMDDKRIMLVVNTSTINGASYTLMLVSDNLDIIWTKSIIPDVAVIGNFGSATEFIMDEQKNIYIVGATFGNLGENPKIGVYKLDEQGNLVWKKKYETQKGIFGSLAVTYSNSSLYVIVEASGEASASVKIDKQTGQLLNSYSFAPLWSGLLMRSAAKFENDRIVYIGDNKNENLVLGLFDTTGRPLKMKSLNNSSLARGVDFLGGIAYVTYYYFNGSNDVEVILKVDTALNVTLMKEYHDIVGASRTPRNLHVSPEGNIYMAGIMFTPSEGYPYIIKLDNDGNRGSCNNIIVTPNFSDINLQVETSTYTSLPIDLKESLVPVKFVPDVNGLKIGNILCQSIPQCTYLKLSGPDTVCLSTQGYLYTIEKPAACTVTPQWLVDTALFKIVSTSNTDAIIQFKKPGLINVSAKLNAGCAAQADSVLTFVKNSVNELNLGNNKALCPGDTLRLNAGSGFDSYKWQDMSTDSVLYASAPGTYAVEVMNGCGAPVSDTLLVTAAIVPSLSLANDTLVCTGTMLKLNAAQGFATYYWSGPGVSSPEKPEIAIPVKQPQMLWVEGTTSDGCTAEDSINILTKTATPVSLGNDTSFCATGAITLSPGSGYINYQWNNGVINNPITIKTPGSYWVRATDINGCTASDTIVVKSVYNLPVVDLGNDFDLCKGSMVQLDAGSFSRYKWMDETTTRHHVADEPGEYYVTVTDNNNCSNSDTVMVNRLLLPPSNFLQQVDSLCQYESKLVSATGSFKNYNWSNGASSAKIEVSDPGNYILTVTDFNGCVGKDTIMMVQKDCMSGLFIPNAFTPNGDNMNDIFRAKAYGKVVSFRFEIYDRFGTMIFKTTDSKTGWDGNVKGKTMPSGVYVWQCYCTFEGADMIYKKGSVTLIR